MTEAKLVDGASAVWSQDADMLAKALDAGWSLPSARLKSGRTEDLSLILRVIALGWVDGWRVWLRHRPDFATHPILVEAVIAHAQDDILEVMLQQEGGKLAWEREDDLQPPHLLFQLLGGQIRHLAEDAKIARVARLLGQAGYDPQAPYPGDFQMSDLSPPGHTLWSWAILRSYYDLATALEVGDEAFDMPKHEEAMGHWFDRAWVPSWVSSGKEFDGGRARVAWNAWMTPERFGRWASESHHIRNVELHAALQSLPSAYQAIAWKTWLGEEGEWSSLHDLVSSLLSIDEIRATIDAMQKRLSPEEWGRAWAGKDAYGMSPEGIWESKLQEADPAQG